MIPDKPCSMKTENHLKSQPFDLLLFDLGGVLVENVGLERLSMWLPDVPSPEAVLKQWLASSTVQDFERGRVDPDDFAATVVREFALPVSPDSFLNDFTKWASRLYPGVEDLLHRLSSICRLGCLSNTNVLHWNRGCSVMKLDTRFDYTFVSCETGLLKPDEEAFQYVIHQTGFAPERILFFDDIQRNVDGAARTGIVARKASGLSGVYEVLREFAVIP